jgi:putative DNA primase/helicase
MKNPFQLYRLDPFSSSHNLLAKSWYFLRISTKYRTALKGPREFLWAKKDELTLYGLWKLAEAKEAGFIVLVEGESACQTLWHNEFPAFGLPEPKTWQKGWESSYLADIVTIYVAIHPDHGREDLLARLKESPLCGRIKGWT